MAEDDDSNDLNESTEEKTEIDDFAWKPMGVETNSEDHRNHFAAPYLSLRSLQGLGNCDVSKRD